MKVFFLTLLLTMVACQKSEVAESEVTPAATANPVEEDCDDKAKKKIEIKEETISLTGGDAGCSLEESEGQNQF